MLAEIRDPMGDTGTGVGGTVPETQRDITTGIVQYLVVDEVVTLVEETEITAEAEVREGSMVTTPTPLINTGRKFGAAVRTVGKEVGRRRGNDLLGDGGKIFVRPCHQVNNSEAMPSALIGYS